MSESNGYMTRDALFSSPEPQRRFSDVTIDGFGKFRLRSLTALELAGYVADTQKKKDGDKTSAGRIIALCVVDGDGKRIFGDTDVAKIMEQDARHVIALSSACTAHAGLNNEDAEKNSDATAG